MNAVEVLYRDPGACPNQNINAADRTIGQFFAEFYI